MNLVPSKMQRGHLRGFTLIELLVVIAIIGILSAVVLASLNTARTKGNDAATKSNLSTIQSQAALDYDGYSSSYGTTSSTTQATTITAGTGTPGATNLFNDPTVTSAITQAITSAGSVSYGASGTTFEVAAPMKATTGYWCVDSTGKSLLETGTIPTTAATFVGCP